MVTQTTLSFEFFPPRSDVQRRRFWRAFGALEMYTPRFISMTWGALGSDSEASFDVIEPLVADTNVDVVAHLACAGLDKAGAHAALDRLSSLGVRQVLAIRGDAHAESVSSQSDQLGHATDLVELIAERGDFDVSVAAYPDVHPEARSAEDDLHWLCRKAELGASRAITQFFFDAEHFLRLRDALMQRGLEMDLVPGILPIHDIERICQFSADCGAQIPHALVERFRAIETGESRIELATEVAFNLCERLRAEGVRHFHLYTLNRSDLASSLAHALGVTPVHRYAAA